MLVFGGCNHTSTYIQWSIMISSKPCEFQIAKMYDLVLAACGFFNLLKVDMFLNPTDIKSAQAATNKSLLYTPEVEVLAEFHVLPQMNPFYILLNAGYPMIFYWENCAMRFVLIVC